MYKVGCYGRVSTGRKEQDSSLENQQLMFEQYLESKGWEISELYIERTSGTKAKRPQLMRLIEDIKLKKIDILLVKDLSRLARNGELSYKIANLTKEKGVHIISLDGMVNTMENNADVFGLLAWLYEKESENLSKRIKSTKKAGAIKGRYQGSLPPYGYSLKDGKLFMRTDDTPKIVRRIFREYLEGTGVDSVARQLTMEEIPTPSQIIGKKNAGTEWQGSTVKGILKNQHYIGNLVQGKTETISVVSTKRKNNGESNQIIVEKTHEAIISELDFNATQREMKKRKKDITAPKLHLFTNKAYCGDCGKGMWFRSDSNRYICGSYGRYGKSKCSSHSIKENKLKEAIVKEFGVLLDFFNPSLLFKQFDSKIEKALNQSKKEVEKIEKQMKLIGKRKVKYVQMLADEQLDIETFQLVTKKDKAELKKLKEQLDNLDSNYKQNDYNLETLKEDFFEYLYSDDVFIELIHRFISRIEIEEDGTVNIYYNFQDPKKESVAS